VDDICDGGGTFIGLVDALKKKNAGDLYLAVSHGIFSKGFDELTGSFKTIFTTDSFRDIEGVKGVTQIKLNQCK
jgi:ribose-phosphate pyrophosphokinase